MLRRLCRCIFRPHISANSLLLTVQPVLAEWVSSWHIIYGSQLDSHVSPPGRQFTTTEPSMSGPPCNSGRFEVFFFCLERVWGHGPDQFQIVRYNPLFCVPFLIRHFSRISKRHQVPFVQSADHVSERGVRRPFTATVPVSGVGVLPPTHAYTWSSEKSLDLSSRSRRT